MIPQNYEQWRYCITHDCRLELTESYIKERIAVLTTPTKEETRLFIQKYGENHWRQIVLWFKRAYAELT